MAAVDLGAQSGRVAVGEFDGERLRVEEVSRFENTPIEGDGRLRWNTQRLFDDAVDGLGAASGLGRIASVAVDAWAVDFGLVDAGGRLIRAPVHYRDRRRADAVAGVYSRVAPRELYERTGIQLLPINSIFELAAMVLEDDPALGEAATLLMVPDLLHCLLCGSRSSEFTNATTTQCFDLLERTWASDLLERLRIPARLMPEVVAPGTRLGAVDDGPLDGTAVIAVATHDTGSAVAAVPFRRPGSVFISAGTWSLVGMEIDAPLITDASYAANLTNEGGVGGTFRLIKNVTGLWLLHESRRAWAAVGLSRSFEELLHAAAEAPPFRSLIDPDHQSFAAPGDMPARIRTFCKASGQPAPADPGASSRCVLESIALKHAVTVDLLRDVTGTEPREVHIVGGGAQNDLLCQWTADATGLPVIAGPVEATLIGNLLVQAMTLGELGSLEQAREVVRSSFRPRVHEPRPSDEWAGARERFAGLVPAAGVSPVA